MKYDIHTGEWQEWMGYSVQYMAFNNDGPFVEHDTSFGVSMVTAQDTMRRILQTGRCAWIVKVDPIKYEDVPF